MQSEERANKLKQLLVKCKRDLSDAKKLEAEQRENDAQLKGQIEVLTQLCEEQKVGKGKDQMVVLTQVGEEKKVGNGKMEVLTQVCEEKRLEWGIGGWWC